MQAKDMIFFNRAEMIKYFNGFDYLEVKSERLLNDVDCKYAPQIKKLMCDYELNKHHSIYSNIKYYDVFEKIKKIYGNENEIARKMTFLYDFAISRLLDRYIDVDTLIRLFNHHFFEFEWRQHIDYNFKENRLSFYRDHFIHQIRNCYMILKLLESDCSTVDGKIKVTPSRLMREIKSVLNVSLDNELAKYVRVNVNNYADKIRNRLQSIGENYLKSDGNENASEVLRSVKANISDFALEYLIRGALIIAALFHDIGYPVVFMRENAEQLNEFLASIFPQDGLSFERLNDLLGTSLLFTLIPKRVLKTMYEKKDHGAFSAFILLLHFYETGTIRSLGDGKKAMIELAALAIFNHTVGNYYKDNPECGYKPSFSADPISYTLRFVDDLQEWERVYFEVRKVGDLRYCEKCKMPIIKKWDIDIKKQIKEQAKQLIDEKIKKYFEVEPADGFLPFDFDYVSAVLPEYNMKRLYVCGCAEHHGSKTEDMVTLDDWHYSTGAFEKGTLFPDMRINYTVICSSVAYLDSEQKFYLDYDPFKAIYLLNLNNHALDTRIKGLKHLNHQFEFQEGVEYKMVTNMTNNPLMLKLRIICNFLYELGYYAYFVWKLSHATDNDKQRISRNINPLYLGILGENTSQAKNIFESIFIISKGLKGSGVFVYDYSDEALVDSNDYPNKNKKEKKEIIEKIDEVLSIPELIDYFVHKIKTGFKKNLINTIYRYFDLLKSILNKRVENFVITNMSYFDSHYNACCKYLLSDAKKQLDCLKENHTLIPYYENCFDKEAMAEAVQTVLNSRYYKPDIILRMKKNRKKDKMDYFDVFSDLYLFKEMYRFMQDNIKRRTGDFDSEANNRYTLT